MSLTVSDTAAPRPGVKIKSREETKRGKPANLEQSKDAS